MCVCVCVCQSVYITISINHSVEIESERKSQFLFLPQHPPLSPSLSLLVIPYKSSYQTYLYTLTYARTGSYIHILYVYKSVYIPSLSVCLSVSLALSLSLFIHMRMRVCVSIYLSTIDVAGDVLFSDPTPQIQFEELTQLQDTQF